MKNRKMPPFGDGSPVASKDQSLNDLFRAYHAACEPGEVSANFMPDLWRKIDQTQNASFSFRRIAKSFVTLAAAVSMLLALISFAPPTSGFMSSSSYVEALAAHNDALSARSTESVQYILELMHPDVSEDGAGEI